ncbi:hypothetical protein [Streptomyces pinistramenti]|uniref:hypothetical protein n=1 Tax=Streptomyces pinistramenti TaxID=2884812 RepID=UPI001D07EE4C|nr:hypothetical protein [Streptomyces pinistramenti]MCB5906517.1 hypothetical protein [Streptomyces pinistramenti]
MTTADLLPQEVSPWALRAGLPLAAERLDPVAATANHVQGVIGALRALDFAETAPAATYFAGEEPADAAV